MAQDFGSSRWLIAGTQDNGTCRYTGSAIWDHIADGDGGDCGVNRANPNIVYHTYYNMGMERSAAKGNFGSFSWIFPAVPSGYSNLFYPRWNAIMILWPWQDKQYMYHVTRGPAGTIYPWQRELLPPCICQTK